MSAAKKVGYAVASAKGTALKLYEGNRFVGLISFADIECAKKSRVFVATIIKFSSKTEQQPSNATVKAEKTLNFSLNLFDAPNTA